MFDPSWDADSGRPRRQHRRHFARFLAPVALVVVIVGAYLIVDRGLQSTNHPASVVRPVTHLTRSQRFYAHRRYYTVRSGQSLTGIVAKTGVSMSRLEDLNPHLALNSLQPGQRLRLRR
jgi:hypothetical protein